MPVTEPVLMMASPWLMCGTAACAAAVAAARLKRTGRKVKVTLPGGDLLIEWRESDGHILMTGPYSLDFEGTLPASLL